MGPRGTKCEVSILNLRTFNEVMRSLNNTGPLAAVDRQSFNKECERKSMPRLRLKYKVTACTRNEADSP